MELIEFLKAIVIGIIQGITEWLPVSSTGHMILANEFVKLSVSDEFKEMFFVVIQLGSILAVVVLFFHKLNPISPKKTAIEKKETLTLWGKVLIASIPAGIIGFLFDDKLDAIFYNYQTVSITLILYGILFIILENRNRKRTPAIKDLSSLTYQTAFIIGAFQVLSLIPGTSRSGSTILGAILIGTSRYVAAEFSFFMAVPAMFGASGWKVFKYIKHGMENGFTLTGTEVMIMITGMVVAFVVSIVAIKFLMGYIKKHDFKAFGYYRIILGIVVIAYFLLVK